MLFASGWIVVRTSRDCYKNVISFDGIDALDDGADDADRTLWRKLQNWLESNDDPWLKWQFFEKINNASGVLQVFTSRNHRSSSLWKLIEWIATHGIGSYGLVYVHDG